jgi:uncharacterized protein YciI
VVIARRFAVIVALGGLSLAAQAQSAGAGAARAGAPGMGSPRPASPDTADRGDTVQGAGPGGAVRPAADEARGLDAEIRAALFELATDRPLAALVRLAGASAGAELGARAVGVEAKAPEQNALAGLLRSHADLLFVRAECEYRLGSSSAFRRTAEELLALSDGARYAGLIGTQLMLDAYRNGDYTRVLQLAGRGAGGESASAGSDRALRALLTGLAAYRTGDFVGARAAFAAARGAGGVYAPYAQYMEALAVLAGDTTRARAALEMIRPLAETATGAFGDQVRLTAAELAFEAGAYDTAAAYAGLVAAGGAGGGEGEAGSGERGGQRGGESGGGGGRVGALTAPALLTRAWALYRGGALDSARAAFATFATRYPMLPARDEARLMLGQVMLEQGRSEEAGNYLQAVADSLGAEVAALEAEARVALSQAARALVAARMAALAFMDPPGGAGDGKTLALPDATGAERPAILAAFAGSPVPAGSIPPRVVALGDVLARFDTLGPAFAGGLPRRILLAGVVTPASAAAYTARAEALRETDLAVAVAERRLQDQLEAHRARIAALEELDRLIAAGRADLEAQARTLAATQDSLDRVRIALARSRARVREMLAAQAEATRRMAAENLTVADSVRSAVAPVASASEQEILRIESETAAIYQRVASMVAGELDAAIDRHPAFALRDSLSARLGRARSLHDEAAAVLASDDRVVRGALAVLRGGEPEAVRGARAALARAESLRAAAEQQLVALLDTEFLERSRLVAAGLRHDREVADYGAASAAFFRAIEPTTPGARSDSEPEPPGGPGSARASSVPPRANGTTARPEPAATARPGPAATARPGPGEDRAEPATLKRRDRAPASP